MCAVQDPKPTRRRKGKSKLVAEVQSGKRHRAATVTSSADMSNAMITKTGWAGIEFRRRAESRWLRDAWLQHKLMRIMVLELQFQKVPYNG